MDELEIGEDADLIADLEMDEQLLSDTEDDIRDHNDERGL